VPAKIANTSAAGAPDAHPAGVTSIKVVSELTGLPMGTLRAWERRYGFPRPTRREGSNRRLYSKADVERLRMMSAALAHGYRPSDVVGLPALELRALLGEQAEPARVAARGVAIADVGAMLELLARDDVKRIEDELRLAAAALGPKRFVTDLAHPLALAVGKAWAEGKIAIRQEHLMTECLTTQLRTLLAAQQAVDGSPTIVLTTLPGEPHTLGLQMVALYTALSAAKPRFLGASTPPAQIIAAARAFDARVVGITLTPTTEPAATSRELARLARGLPAGTALWAGGAGLKELRRLSSRVEPVMSWAALDAALAKVRAAS
jgi:MerR family transcriptional regulator, light-induced transcriptional regulator